MLLRPARPASPRLLLVLLALGVVLLAGASQAKATGGSVYAWGLNGEGQVGSGSVNSSGCNCVSQPSQVVGLTGVTEISLGENSALALREDGSVWSWGRNEEAQLGYGFPENSPTAKPVPGVAGAVAVAAGDRHALVLLANGTVMAWGNNDHGQLGLTPSGPEECESEACSQTPVQVPGVSGVIAIAAGGSDSYAELADGTVIGWGYAYSGGLGGQIPYETECECVDHPVPIPGAAGAASITAGIAGGMALMPDQTVRIWGYGTLGEAGDGTLPTNEPCFCIAPSTVPSLTGVREISAGYDSPAAVLSDGSLRKWGWNDNGQLGNGSETEPEKCKGSACSKVPVPVVGVSGVVESETGVSHALALLGNGNVDGWGHGSSGELAGLGTSLVPGSIPGVSGATEVGASAYSSFALVGLTQTLTVAMAGDATGTAVGHRIDCPPSCTARVPQGQVTILRPASTAAFAGWTGAGCSGLGPCAAKLSSDQTVTATFGKPKGTKITKAKVDRKKKRATFSFETPGAITGYQCLLVKPKPKKRGSAHGSAAKKGKKKPKFSKCASGKPFKHLKPGSYTLKVKALNILGAEEKPAKRKFKLKPPKR